MAIEFGRRGVMVDVCDERGIDGESIARPCALLYGIWGNSPVDEDNDDDDDDDDADPTDEEDMPRDDEDDTGLVLLIRGR